MSEAYRVSGHAAQAGSGQKSRLKRIAVIAERIITAPHRALDAAFDAACEATAGIPDRTEPKERKVDRRRQRFSDHMTLASVINTINQIPADRWSGYSRRTKTSSAEGMSAPMESTMKVSLEMRTITDRRDRRSVYGTTINTISTYHFEVRSGMTMVFESSDAEVMPLFHRIKEKVEAFEKLPETERAKITEQRKADLMRELKGPDGQENR
ncbi:Uncharacterised protein [uncultured archaeon]|nr:Uncharacterised protein [uncultured archaeon]